MLWYPSQVNSRHGAGVRLADTTRTALHKLFTLKLKVKLVSNQFMTIYCLLIFVKPAKQERQKDTWIKF